MTQVDLPAADGRAKALKKASGLLTAAASVLILTHKSPDGDTVGSAFALCRALKKLGKKVNVICSDALPRKYNYLFEGLKLDKTEPELVVAADIATVDLFGKNLESYADKVDLCIDHHPSNTGYAGFTLCDPAAAATCEIMVEIIDLLDVEINKDIASCIYTGIATDTGCFCYSNTTPKTLRTAAAMIEKGADSVKINKQLFETKSRARLELEKMALETLEYHFNGKAALITVTKAMREKSGADESETEGIPAIPARIEGVMAGITVKESEDGFYKISLRSVSPLNASEICANLGGGGHAAAAGCSVKGSLDAAKNAILKEVKAGLISKGLKSEEKVE